METWKARWNQALLMIVGVVWLATACGSSRQPTAGFWFDNDLGPIPSEPTAKLGGPLNPSELEHIEALARTELGAAFADFNIAITPDPAAYWRVRVTRELSYRG